MSVLTIQLTPRTRLQSQGEAGAPRAPAEYAYALASDDLALQREGRAAASLLPRATTVVAVVGEADVSWHRITCPKANAARMRSALAGVLEEALLDELDAVHIALPTAARAGDAVWVAVTDRAWLAAELAALEQAGMMVDRVAPTVWPDEPPLVHFHETAARDGAAAPVPALTYASAQGVISVPLAGTLARTLLPQPLPDDTVFTAVASVAAPAERWLGRPVTVASPGERLLAAARSSWNLRQFDLAPKSRGTAALRDRWRRFMSPAWRPARIGLASLAVLNILGLNVWAFAQTRQIASKQEAIAKLAQAAFPKTTFYGDAAVTQMQRETDALRATAGQIGDGDLETLMQAIASAWPTERPVQNLRFDNGQLSVAVAGWSEPEINQLRDTLRPAGWQVDSADGRLSVRKSGARP
jgi:general secretion pathway protein L